MDTQTSDWLQTYCESRGGRVLHRGHCRACDSDWTIGEHWDPMKVLGDGRHTESCPAGQRLRRTR